MLNKCTIKKIPLAEVELSIIARFGSDFQMQDNQGSTINRKHIRQYLSHQRGHTLELVRQTYLWTPGTLVAEIGVAYGATIMCLQSMGDFQVQAYELERNIPVYCNEIIASGIPVKPLDLYEDTLAVEPGTLDFLILSEVVEHLYSDLSLLASRLRPCLRIGGRLLLTTPNVYRLGNLVRVAMGRPITERHSKVPRRIAGETVDSRGHPREYTRYELKEAFSTNGWKYCKVWTQTNDRGNQRGIINRAKGVANRLVPWFGTVLFCVAERIR